MFDKYKFSYQPNNSIIHMLNPVIKIACFFIFFLSCFFRYDYYLLIIMTGITLLLVFFSNVHIKYYLKVIYKLIFVFLLAGVIMYRFTMSLDEIIPILLKVLYLILYIYVILYTTPPEKTAKGLSAVLNTFNIFGIKKEKIEKFITFSLKKVYFSLDSTDEVLASKSLKGQDYAYKNNFSKKLLIFKSRKGISEINKEKMAEYQDELKYKMYDTNKKKYPYRKKIGIIDIIVLMAHLSLIIYYIARVR